MPCSLTAADTDPLFHAFQSAPKAAQLAFIDDLAPKQAKALANLYSRWLRASDPENDRDSTDIWIALLNRASPSAYQDEAQDGQERDRVDAAHLAGKTSLEAVAEFLASCDALKTTEADDRVEDARSDGLDPTGTES